MSGFIAYSWMDSSWGDISPTIRGRTAELARWSMSHGAHHCSVFALMVGVTVSFGQFIIMFIRCGNS